MFKSLMSVVFVLLITLTVRAQNKPVQFEELKALQTIEPRPVVVLISTDWCKYCHAMQNTMLSNPKISLLLRNKFYTVYLNVEEKKNIFFAGREFKFKSGVNELAGELATVNGRISYPTLCILNTKNEIIYQYGGFLSVKAMEYALKKIGSAAY